MYTKEIECYCLNNKKRSNAEELFFNRYAIEIVKEFRYLGIIFSRSCSFCKGNKKRLCEQAQKAMYDIIRKIRQTGDKKPYKIMTIDIDQIYLKYIIS